MAQTFFDLLTNSGGRVEYVWYCLGLPWAVSTHADVAAALDTADKEAMFGVAQFDVDATTIYPGVTGVTIYPILDRPKAYDIKYHEKDGFLSGGDWSVSVTREPIGASYTHRSGTIWGLEGLDTCPDDRIDPTICRARLAANLVDGGSTLTFTDDVGGRLVAKATANFATDTPTYIWLGNECMAIRTVPVAAGDNYTCTVARGVWRTMVAEHYMEDWDGGAALISDAPLGGIVGRDCVLYAIPMDVGRIKHPVRVMSGLVQSGIRGRPGERWNIPCSPWWKYLDQKIRAGSPSMAMKGYTLSRCPDMTATTSYTWDHEFVDQAPHIWLREWNGAAYETKEIWLCAEGASVHFKNYNQLKAAIEVEIQKLTESDGTAYSATVNGGATVDNYLDNNYIVTNRGLERVSASDSNSSIMSGVIPWICGWGAYKQGEEFNNLTRLAAGSHQWFTKNSQLGGDPVTPHLGVYNTGIGTIDTGLGTYSLDTPNGKQKYRSRFLVQYEWATTILATASDSLLAFPVPAVSGTEAVYVQNDYDATKFANDVIIQCGNADHIGIGDRPMVGYGKVSSTADNYVVLTADVDWRSDITGIPPGSDGSASFKHVDGIEEPFGKGFCMFSVPACHNSPLYCDPTGTRWLLTDQKVVRADSFVELMRGLLGADTSATDLGGRFTLSNVPDSHSSDVLWTGDHIDMIDWDQLEAVTTVDAIDGVYWEVILDDSFSVLDLLRNALLFCQAMPTWEYRSAVNAWVIGFRPMGIVNATAAWLEGRVIDTTTRIADSVPEESANNTWLFGSVNVKMHYSAAQKKFLINTNARNMGGRRAPGGDSDVLKIETKAAHIEGGEDAATDNELVQQISNYFGQLLRRVEWPSPTFSVKCTSDALLVTALGRECLLTDPTARNPFTGEQGLTLQPGLVTGQRIDLEKSMVVNEVRISPRATYGYAPALIIPANVGGGTTYMTLVGTTLTVGNLATDPANNDCADPNGEVTDLFYFDCLVYNESTDTEAANPNCSCSDYEIIIFDRNAGGSSYDEATPGRNFWTGTIGSVDTAAGSCVISLDNADDFSVSTAKVVKFNDLDTTGLQPCQEYYLVFGNEDGEVVDQDAAKASAGSWT